MERKKFKAEIKEKMLLGEFLRKELNISAGLLRRLKNIPDGITRNGKLIRTVDEVFPNDVIELCEIDTNEIEPNPDLKVDVIYEDEEIIVFNKPSGMPVHPSHRHRYDTLGNYFSYIYPNKSFRPINRLDRDTSGACAVAKSQRSAGYYQGKIQKTYYAFVSGKIDGKGTISLPIKRMNDTIITRFCCYDGQKAVTHYKSICCNEKASFLEIDLETGRTHQIRVHFSHIGHPLLGDDLYGGNHNIIERQALHCGKLHFKNIIDNKDTYIKAPFQKELVDLERKLFKSIDETDNIISAFM